MHCCFKGDGPGYVQNPPVCCADILMLKETLTGSPSMEEKIMLSLGHTVDVFNRTQYEMFF